MKEQLITFETAKLAKEMGFQSYTPFYYSEDGEIKGTKIGMHGNPNAYGGISAPTQSLLQKWLREVHSIYVSIDYLIIEVIDSKGVRFDWSIYNKNESIESKELIGLLTYEEALEKGLVAALKLILR